MIYPFNIATKKRPKKETKNKNNTFKIDLANEPKFHLSCYMQLFRDSISNPHIFYYKLDFSILIKHLAFYVIEIIPEEATLEGV